MENERSGPEGCLVYVAVAMFGVMGGALIANGTADTDSRIKNVQAQYQQLHDQLDSAYGQVSNLELKDRAKTFSFSVSSEGQPTQECRGSYTVNQVAQVAGDIACTVSGPLPGSTAVSLVTTTTMR